MFHRDEPDPVAPPGLWPRSMYPKVNTEGFSKDECVRFVNNTTSYQYHGSTGNNNNTDIIKNININETNKNKNKRKQKSTKTGKSIFVVAHKILEHELLHVKFLIVIFSFAWIHLHCTRHDKLTNQLRYT